MALPGEGCFVRYAAGTVWFSNSSDFAGVSSRSAIGLHCPAGTGFGRMRKLGLRTSFPQDGNLPSSAVSLFSVITVFCVSAIQRTYNPTKQQHDQSAYCTRAPGSPLAAPLVTRTHHRHPELVSGSIRCQPPSLQQRQIIRPAKEDHRPAGDRINGTHAGHQSVSGAGRRNAHWRRAFHVDQ